jgi:hypothetical protein
MVTILDGMYPISDKLSSRPDGDNFSWNVSILEMLSSRPDGDNFSLNVPQGELSFITYFLWCVWNV